MKLNVMVVVFVLRLVMKVPLNLLTEKQNWFQKLIVMAWVIVYRNVLQALLQLKKEKRQRLLKKQLRQIWPMKKRPLTLTRIYPVVVPEIR